ncbi:MAG: ABC transporter permease subunit [Proteobacteria bacterium]|nr:ABC transporter permease subunit [Pseudomonadota bacterium]
MQQIKHIFYKELKDYFTSPIAYIVISIFLLVTGWFFFMAFFLSNQASLRSFFSLLPFTFAFVIPAVTMRLFSEEMSIGSYEVLMTLPVSLSDIVVGKFLAGSAFVAAMLLPTLAYPLTISFVGNLDWGPVVGGYLGAFFLGSAYTAVGLFASALTRNQIIAFIIGVLVCFSLTLVDKMLFFFPQSIVQVVGYIGADFHFQNISKGIVDSRDILYFASVIFISLYGSALAMTEKK